MASMTWAIITGEYPPQLGGVSDYTWRLAQALAESGDDVRVYAPECGIADPPGRVEVHRFAKGFGLIGMVRLRIELSKLPQPRRVLVQYVIQSFGMRAMNVFFALGMRTLHGFPLWVMFHEYVIDDSKTMSPLRRLQAWVTRQIGMTVARSSDFYFISIPAWADRIARGAPNVPYRWLPVPSNLEVVADLTEVQELRAGIAPDGRALIGHFGSYRMKDAVDFLSRLVVTILEADENCTFIFLGRGSAEFVSTLYAAHAKYKQQIYATGSLSAHELAVHLSACDALVQPYEDGVSTRRGSLMAGLALGVPIVTSSGVNTEDLWEGAVELVPFDVDLTVERLQRLIGDRALRERLSINSRMLYNKTFAVERLVAVLREVSNGEDVNAKV